MVAYTLYKYSWFIDEGRNIYHLVYQVRYKDFANKLVVMEGNKPKTEKLYSKIYDWCNENLPHDEYRITKTIHGGIKITLKNQETAMAFRLRWEND